MKTIVKKMKMKLFALLALSLLFSFTAQAKWYEATGQAKIRHGDVRSAKNRALQDAIKQAMLFSGANVSSVQRISKGLLQDDYTQINSHAAINQIEIVDETTRGSFISVTIRADIFAESQECYAADFSKKIAINQKTIACQI